MEGVGGPYKANENKQGEGKVKPLCMLALWKKLPNFQTANRVLSDKLFGSW